MRIAIVGAGAIGCLFGIRLHLSGQKVLLVHHNHLTVAALRAKGVTLKDLSGRIIRAAIPVKATLSRRDRPDLVLLTVKAYDTEKAARSLSRQVGANIPILSLQNGLGNIESLSRYFVESQILIGTTTEAALQTNPGLVLHRGRGATWVGELRPIITGRCKRIAKVFDRAGFHARTSRNIVGVVWSKAIVNSAINPISALARVSNRDIARIASLREAALALVLEGESVAHARGVVPTPSPRTLLSNILAASGLNRSSMLQDIEAGRKTEIREINGKIVSIGQRLRTDTSLNMLVTELILGLESSQRFR